jgi:hypothetical protein
MLDTLAMENSIPRNRTLAALVQVALHTLEVGDIEARIEALEEMAKIKKYKDGRILILGIEYRLIRLESKRRFSNPLLEHSVNADEVIRHMGFDPAVLRKSAHHTGKSVAEMMCEIIGIEPREFEHMLREKAKLAM